MIYDVGDTVKLKATILDEAGDPADPATLTLKVEKPDGNIDEYTHPTDITKDGVGLYSKLVAIDQIGSWYYRWISSGPGQAEEGDFFVRITKVS